MINLKKVNRKFQLASGDIEAVKKVTLGDTSILTGNLNASTLTIEEGAKFEGVCNMKDKSSKQKMDNTKN